MSKQFLTPDEIIELNRLVKLRMPVLAMAHELGRSPDTIYSMLRRLGAPVNKGNAPAHVPHKRNKWTAQMIAVLKRDYPDKHVPMSALVNELGVLRQTIRDKARELGLPPRRIFTGNGNTPRLSDDEQPVIAHYSGRPHKLRIDAPVLPEAPLPPCPTDGQANMVKIRIDKRTEIICRRDKVDAVRARYENRNKNI